MTEDLERLSKLTERQKACLRLVHRAMSSKEIAIELKLSPRSVDTYLSDALKLLGTASRGEAARMLAAFEANGLSQKLRSQPQALVSPLNSATIGAAANEEMQPLSGVGSQVVMEDQRSYDPGPLPRVPIGGPVINGSIKLKVWQKLALIALVAFLSILAVGGLLAGLNALAALL